MFDESILSGIKIPDNPDDLIKEFKKEVGENWMHYDNEIQEECKDQIIRMGGGNLFGLPSPYDKFIK